MCNNIVFHFFYNIFRVLSLTHSQTGLYRSFGYQGSFVWLTNRLRFASTASNQPEKEEKDIETSVQRAAVWLCLRYGNASNTNRNQITTFRTVENHLSKFHSTLDACNGTPSVRVQSNHTHTNKHAHIFLLFFSSFFFNINKMRKDKQSGGMWKWRCVWVGADISFRSEKPRKYTTEL